VGVRHFSYEQVGVLYSLNGVIVVLLQMPIALGIRRHHLEWIAVGTLCYGAAFLTFNYGFAYAAFLAGIVVLTIGENIVSPLQNTTIAAVAPRDARGSYFGAYSAVTTVATILAPPIGTLLLGTGNSLILWGSMALLTAAVAVGYLALGRRRSLDPPPAGESNPQVV